MLWALQQAVYAALAGDATLMAKITGVHDHVPQGGAFPYVVIGDGQALEWDTDTETGLDATIVVHAWDRVHRGRRTIKQIQDDIRRILHRAELQVAGSPAVLSVVQYTESFRDADGLTFHGVQRVRVVVEEE
jgi:hypothetical protein